MVGAYIPPAIPYTAVDHDLPVTLHDLLSNTLILDNITAYLPLSSIFRLSRTSPSLRALLLNTRGVFRHVNLSRCRGAYVPPDMIPIDSGGYSWRCHRIDENLTEDEFYAGPLRGIFSSLSRMSILRDVQVLVLDGLGSVTIDLVSEIIMDQSYDVRILSVVGCVNLNQRRLQQLLCYVCRPSRPEGSPRLKGLYVFGAKEVSKAELQIPSSRAWGVTSAEGAQLGSAPLPPDSITAIADPWYSPAGVVLPQIHKERRTPWEETLQVCQGIIAFDAVLCLHMHSAMEPYLSSFSIDYLMTKHRTVPPLATIALGPHGCAGCGKAPEGAPEWGKENLMSFPLLRPPPLSGRIVDAVRPPSTIVGGKHTSQGQRLVVSCAACARDRHCESCQRWWCGECYDPEKPTLPKVSTSEAIPTSEESDDPTAPGLTPSGIAVDGNSTGTQGDSIKVFNGLCVEHCLVGEMMAGAGSNGMWA